MKQSTIAVAVGLAFAVHGEGTYALPEGGQVSAGQGTIGAPANGSLVVHQQSSRLAIDWLRFGIGTGESVHFAQPGASAIALNRVLGTDPSRIYGSLSATGQVFLLNPNGVLFAPGSQVNVGGLVASTLGLSNEDFLAGRYVFSKGERAGAVVNQGEITAGYAALLGPQVSNEGIITATLGSVALAAGEQITLRLNGTSLVGLTVDKGALDAMAANKHLIRADGGTVILTARATDELLRNVVNNDGIIEARTLSARDGVIRLESTGSGITSVSGSLNAKQIAVTGDKVGLFDGARLDAPGGTILVGGNYQGQGPERNSSATYVARGAMLNADAVGEGDGGRVIVWSDGATRYYGTTSVRGGGQSGKGGFVEVSGKEYLDFRGDVILSGANGRGGVLLLDPTDIDLIAAGGNLDGELNGTADPSILFNQGGANTTLSVAELTTGFASGDTVILEATNNVIFDEPVAMQAGVNLTVRPDTDGVGGGAFNLSANLSTNVLTVNGPLNHTAGMLTVGGGNITGLYDFSAPAPGGLTINGGTLTLTGGMNWSGTGAISGSGIFPAFAIASGATATLTGGNKTLSSIPYENLGTTQINLTPGNSLTVNSGASFNVYPGGAVEFLGNNNSISGTGNFENSGGTVANLSTGTNTISTDGISWFDATWGASTGRLNVAPGSSASFSNTTDIVGNEVFFSGNLFFNNFGGNPNVVNGTFNLDGVSLSVNNTSLTINDTLNWSGTGAISGSGIFPAFAIASGATATLTGGNKTLSSIPYENLGTTQINLTPGNSLTVNSGASFNVYPGGAVEFLGNNNSISGTGNFENSGGTVANLSTGTNTISTDGISWFDATWGASTGRLNVAPGSSASFSNTTDIVGNEVFFSGNLFFNNFGGNPNVVNGTFNLDGVSLSVNNTSLTINDTLNWSGTGAISGSGIFPAFAIASGATATLTGGNKTLSSIPYENLGTTQINLTPGNSLTVNSGASFNVYPGGAVEFLGNNNSISGTGNFENSGGTVANLSTGTNTISTDGISWFDATWGASTGRLNVAPGLTASFSNTTDIVGNGVFFSGNLFFNNFGGNPNVVNGTFNLDGVALQVSAPTLTMNGPVNVESDTTITLGTNNIVFQNTINGANDLTITSSGAGMITFNGAIGSTTPLADLSITTGTALTLPQTTLSGDLSVTAGGNIGQNGRVTVGGTASFDAGSESINLNNLLNDFQGPVSLASGGGTLWFHQITDRNNLQLGTMTLDDGMGLMLRTGTAALGGQPAETGHLTQTSPLNVFVNLETWGTQSDILLNQANNIAEVQPFTLINPGGGTWRDVSLRNLSTFGGAWNINSLNSWAPVGGDLTLSARRQVGQTNPISVVGTTSVDAGSESINLNNLLNDFQGPVSLTSGGGTLWFHQITDRNNLQLGTMTLDDGMGLMLRTGTAALGGQPAETGHLTQTSPLNVFVNLETWGTQSDILLNQANNVAEVEPFTLINPGGGTWRDVSLRNLSTFGGAWNINSLNSWAPIGGDLTLSARRQVGQTNPISVVGTTSVDAGSESINLNNLLNDFQGPVSLASGGGTLWFHQITDRNNLQLGTMTLDDGMGLMLRTGTAALGGQPAETGHLTQTSPLNVFVNLETWGTQSDILLNQANNIAEVQPFTLINPGGGTWRDVSLRNLSTFGGAWNINSLNSWAPVGGDLTLSARRQVGQTNPISVVGTTSVDAGSESINLNNLLNDFQGPVSLTSGGGTLWFHQITDRNNLQLGTMTLDDGMGLMLRTGTAALGGQPAETGHLTQTSPLNVFVNLETWGTQSDILLNQANNVAEVEPFTLINPGGGTWRDVSLRNLSTFGGAWNINSLNSWAPIGGDLTLSARRQVGQTNPISVVGTTSVDAGSESINLNNLLNDFQDAVSVTSASSVNLVDVNALTLGPINASGLVSAQAATDLAINGGATIATAAAGNSVVLVAGGNFANNAGTVSTPAGRWLIYSTSPGGSTEGGLTGAADPAMPRLYNRTFAANGPATIGGGNHLIYSAQPSLNITAQGASRPAGTPNPAFTFSVLGGYVVDDGYTDTLVNAGFSGSLTTTAAIGSLPGPYAITQGTLASGAGYALPFTIGTLTVNSVAVIPATITAVSPPVTTLAIPPQAYRDTLAGIHENRVAAQLPVEYSNLLTIENGGMRLPQGLEP